MGWESYGYDCGRDRSTTPDKWIDKYGIIITIVVFILWLCARLFF